MLALLPAGIFALIATQISALSSGGPIAWRADWLPSLGIGIGLYLDGLSAVFALLVSGIGALVFIYAGYYFADHDQPHDDAHKPDHKHAHKPSPLPEDARFFLYLLLFMVCMLGLVLAGDIITLFAFWEGTSITSFLLVAYKSQDEAARRGAFRALFITGGGGIALMAGLVFVAYIAGSSDIATILTQGDALRASPLYAVALVLVAFGAFTKSAQFPFHFWLPGAMSAPTPASAYLHSATMVKAGLYLMARLYPALGGTEMWFWLLTSGGTLTMLIGAFYGLRQNDLKGLLAYSTISQLGVLMLLLGQHSAEAFKAFIVGLIAHALYKGALFLVAGIVDHAAHTRDLRKLAVLRLAKAMPLTLAVGSVVAISMAGLPPLFGFLAKETLLAATVKEPVWGWLISIAVVIMGALMLVQAAILIVDTFFGKAEPEDTHAHPHEPPLGMLLAPALLGLLSILFAFEHYIPLVSLESLVALAGTAAFGAPVKANLALFHGINTPLILSGVAITLGIILFAVRGRWVNREAFAAAPTFSMNRVYDGVVHGLDRAAFWATRLQSGSLRRYLAVMLIGMGGLFVIVALPHSDLLRAWQTGWTPVSFPSGIQSYLRVFSLILVVGASATSVVLKRDLLAILALGASGLAMALLIALEPSPDVALVQIVVDVLTTLLLLFALVKLPKNGRFPNPFGNEEPPVKHQAPILKLNMRDALLAAGSGVIVAAICFFALSSRPRDSMVTPYYEQNSESLTGAHDIVGAIIVDFRGFDTMIEITVFSMAGLAVFTILRFAAIRHPVAPDIALLREHHEPPQAPPRVFGITGPRLSPLIRLLAQFVMPIVLVVGIVHMIYGHEQPGDGFTAGVIISIGIGFTYLVFGYHEARERLAWLKPPIFIGTGMLIVMVGSIAPALMGGHFFAPFDFGKALNLPLPYGFYFSTSFLFEIAICSTVIGSASAMLGTMQRTALPQPKAEVAGH